MFVLNVSFFLLAICIYGGLAQDGGKEEESTGALEGGTGEEHGGHTVDVPTWTCRYKGCHLPLEIECLQQEGCYAMKDSFFDCVKELYCVGENLFLQHNRLSFEVEAGETTSWDMAKPDTWMCTTPGCTKDLVRDCPITHSCFAEQKTPFFHNEFCHNNIFCKVIRQDNILPNWKEVKIADSLKARTCEVVGCDQKQLHLNCPEHKTCWGELDRTSEECVKRLACLGTDPNTAQNEGGKWTKIEFKEGDPTWLCTSRLGDENYSNVECKVGEKCVARRKASSSQNGEKRYISLEGIYNLVDEFYCIEDKLLKQKIEEFNTNHNG